MKRKSLDLVNGSLQSARAMDAMTLLARAYRPLDLREAVVGAGRMSDRKERALLHFTGVARRLVRAGLLKKVHGKLVYERTHDGDALARKLAGRS